MKKGTSDSDPAILNLLCPQLPLKSAPLISVEEALGILKKVHNAQKTVSLIC